MSATGAPGMTQLTLGDTTDLWPSIDAGPKARLYYERLADTRPDPRLYMTRIGTTIRTDLTSLGGMQPRVSPKGNEILFTHENPRTGKRDIYRMSDSGGTAENLTNTPDADEGDPVWNRDGTRIAFTSDRGMTADKQHNFDIWVLDLTKPEQPMQITTNGSWDDSPAWDPAGKALYFRSNRGGQWGIWRIEIRN
jgi:Tol biopolymer transport system component